VRIHLLPLFALTFGAVAPAAAQSDADRRSIAEIRAEFEAFNAAWERRDQRFVERFYAHDPDGVFFFERRQLKGWPLVDSLYRVMFASAARGRVESRFEVLDVGARGDVGWIAANFHLAVIEANGDTTVDEGRQSIVFERREGRWVAVHRHTSFQAPPGPQRRVPLHVTPGPLWSPADDTTGGADARAIRLRRAASNAAIARHDTAGIGAVLAFDAIVLSSRSQLDVGRAAHLASFAQHFRSVPDVVYRRTPEAVRVHAPWGMASEEGQWEGTWTEPDGKVSIGGRYFAKWRRTGADWVIESETYVPERCSGSSYCARVP